MNMSLDIDLLRSTFALALERQPEITARFYAIFFERYPQVRPMFSRHDPRRQQEMLAQALVLVVEHVDDAAWLENVLRPLGAKHVSYGVRPEMYAWVGECLLAALAEALGKEWDDATAATWTAAYGAIASIMQAGAAAEQAA
jgi:hemoglobin-like flavoprotein